MISRRKEGGGALAVLTGGALFAAFLSAFSYIRTVKYWRANGNIYIGDAYSTAKYGLIHIYVYALKYGGPSANGGHPGGRRRGGHPGGRRTGGRYTADGHTCLRYGGREDTEGDLAWRQGTLYLIQCRTSVAFFQGKPLGDEVSWERN
jgi:hypothetical protein